MQDILWLVAVLVAWGITAWLFFSKKDASASTAQLNMMRMTMEENMRSMQRDMMQQLNEEMRQMRQELGLSVQRTSSAAAEMQATTQKQVAAAQNMRLKELTEQMGQRQEMLQRAVNTQMQRMQTTVRDQLQMVEERMKTSAMEQEQRLERIRTEMEKSVRAMQEGNEKKLEEMRATVDEKLQKTLEKTLQQSFSRVSEQLESVYRGLGEMQTLATGVGDLKKVLSNVKTRGILGEIQLGAILQQILTPEQYAENIATVKGSRERVEYAVRLPGDEQGEGVWLPIDAKFPADAYAALLDAYDAGDAGAVQSAAKALEQRVCGFAKDIQIKYLHAPETTDFGIMFLPVEGLYAEVVRRGMVERLQREYHVVVAGPTTMAALLNSLQMGFRTLALQKRSGEVWQVLGAVRTEFDKFGEVLASAQNRIEQVGNELEKLVGTRTRQIQRRLRDVTLLPDSVSEDTLE